MPKDAFPLLFLFERFRSPSSASVCRNSRSLSGDHLGDLVQEAKLVRILELLFLFEKKDLCPLVSSLALKHKEEDIHT
jgi:hypothetical protein